MKYIYLYLIENMENPEYNNESKSSSKQILIQLFLFLPFKNNL